MARLPKSIKIVVHDGRNLDYRVAGSKKTPQTRRWRVIFIGGEKKQATGIIEEQDGFPRWDCEVLIAPPRPVDSVRMLVVDGKEREVGQVVINLSDLPWPPTPPPPLVTSKLRVRDLQPTKHNPTPCGQLSFWVWVIDYWPEGTVPIGTSLGSYSAKQTIRGSLSHIGAALKSSQHGSVVASQSEGGDGHSRVGAKFRDIKNRKRENRSGASYVSASGQQDEGSVLMGASILSSQAGLAPTVGGWTSAASEFTEGLTTEGALVNGGGSYNPLAPTEQDDQELFRNRVGRASSMYGTGDAAARMSENTNLHVNDVWNAPEVIPPHSDAAPVMKEAELPKKMPMFESARKAKSRRRAMVGHLRGKLSRSSANLSEIGHKIRSRRSSPDGSRCEQERTESAVSSKSKCGGIRRKLSSAFSRIRYGGKSKDNIRVVQSCIDLRSLMLLDEPNVDGTPPMRLDKRPIIRHSEQILEPNSQYTGNAVKEEWGLPLTQPLPPVRKPPPKIATAGGSAAYGLHPEERPGKSKDDMTKRELIDLTNVLEERLLATRTDLVRANMEQNQLNARIEDLNSELTQTRTQLSSLRNRLLEDNLTQYLEVSGKEGSSTRLLPRSEQLTTFQSPNASPLGAKGAFARSPENSFLSKAKAFASKPFGSGIISNSTSHPNLNNAGLSAQNSLSPPSPARNGTIDYGSVW